MPRSVKASGAEEEAGSTVRRAGYLATLCDVGNRHQFLKSR